MTMTTTESDKGKRRGKKPNGNGAAKKPQQPRKFKEQLPCKLSPDEKAERSSRAAAVHVEIEALEADRKSKAAAIKGEIDAKRAELRDLSRAVHSGEELRDIDVHEEFEFRTGVCIVRRTDTGAELRRRPLTGDERQEKLPLEREAEKGAGKGKAASRAYP